MKYGYEIEPDVLKQMISDRNKRMYGLFKKHFSKISSSQFTEDKSRDYYYLNISGFRKSHPKYNKIVDVLYMQFKHDIANLQDILLDRLFRFTSKDPKEIFFSPGITWIPSQIRFRKDTGFGFINSFYYEETIIVDTMKEFDLKDIKFYFV